MFFGSTASGNLIKPGVYYTDLLLLLLLNNLTVCPATRWLFRVRRRKYSAAYNIVGVQISASILKLISKSEIDNVKEPTVRSILPV